MKETRSKGKDVESKPKDAGAEKQRPRSPSIKPGGQSKTKRSEAKPKDAETVVEHLCPSVLHLVEAKPTG